MTTSVVAMTVIGSGAISKAAYAEPVDTENLPAVWIQVSPTSQRLSLDPGSHHEGKFVVSNIGSGGFGFKVYAGSYKIGDVNYENVSYDSDTPRTQISRWIKFKKTDFYLDSGESAVVEYTVDVPSSVASGGQYAILFAETKPEQSSSGVTAIKRIGSVVYSRISGDTREEGRIVSLDVKSFHFSPSDAESFVMATSVVENTGNVDFDAEYKLDVKSIFGKSAFSNTRTHSVLPDEDIKQRKVLMEWNDAPKLGIFRVTHDVKIAALDQEQSITKIVIIVPMFLIIVVVMVIVLLIVAIVTKKKRDKGRKKKTRINH